ncbi:hypothetical protein [Paraburkholderia nemoris]|uniref:hypothetical protein n=1 Tax=Paraburkholderia nemoris TaxID=2793076 RepID=UPI001F16DB45|nr:hypothetical protein [Paraburkholderia nemoris]
MSLFRKGDRVMIVARDDFYADVDGWKGRVSVVGPAGPCGAHSSVPEGFVLMEVQREGDTPLVFHVPFDQLRLSF